MPVQLCPKCQQKVWIGEDGGCPNCKGTADSLALPKRKPWAAIALVLFIAGCLLVSVINMTTDAIHQNGLARGLSYGVAAAGIFIFGFGAVAKQQALITWGVLIAALGGALAVVSRLVN